MELDGDTAIQQAVRFSLFHILQAGARAEGRALAAKGLTGPGYDGHSFWDTKTFVLLVLTYTAPDATAHALRWRHSTLPLALERATQLGLTGAVFPWRTIRAVKNALVIGQLAPPHFMLMRISPPPKSATSRPQETTISSGRSAWSCWCRPRGCGVHSATMTARADSGSTE